MRVTRRVSASREVGPSRLRGAIVRRGLLLLLILTVLAAQRPGSVLAHAVYVRSNPPENARLTTPPQRIDIWFTEALNRPLSTIHVLDTVGHQQQVSAPQFTSDPTEMFVTVGKLSPGYYTVSWVTVSMVDGHRWDGTFAITVLETNGAAPPGQPPKVTNGTQSAFQPIDSVIRWLLLLGLIGVTGGFGFAAFVLWPATRQLPASLRGPSQSWMINRAERVAGTAATIVLLANFAFLLRQVQQSGSANVFGAVLNGRTGTAWIAREALALAAGLLVWGAARWGAGTRRALLLAGLLLGLGGLASMSFTSHAAAGRGADWAVPSDFLHLAAVALWLGCLAQLPFLLRSTAVPPGEVRFCWQRDVLRRFSTLAVACVGVVLVTGSFNALIQIPTWSALVQTQYGVTLLVKLSLVAPLLGLGLLNATWVSRRFERQARTSAGVSPRESNRFLRRAIAESVAGALVLAATAVLVNLVPATDIQAQNAAKAASKQPAPAFQQITKSADLLVAVTITPNQVGENTFLVQLTGPDLDKIERVQFRLVRSKSEVGRSTLDAQPVPSTAGLFTAAGANLSLAGSWQVAVSVRRAGHDDVDATVADTLGSPGSLSPSAFPAHGISPVAVWPALVLVALWLVLLRWRPRLRRPPALLLGSTAPTLLVMAFLLAGAASGHSALSRTTTHVTGVPMDKELSWPIPTQNAGLMMPTVGPDGSVWIGEMDTNKLARLMPGKNTYQEYSFGPYQGTMGLAVDRQNIVWLAQETAGALGRFDPATGRYTALHPPTPNAAPSAVAVDATGAVWFTELNASRIGRYDPTTQSFREFPLSHTNAVLYWLAVAPDGRIWFTEFGAHRIGVLQPTTGAVTEYGVPNDETPVGIAVESSGTVWFVTTAGTLLRVEPGTGAMTRYAAPIDQLYGIAIGAGKVWAGSASAAAFLAFDPTTGSFTRYPVPAGSDPWWPAFGSDAVWVALANNQGNTLVRLPLS